MTDRRERIARLLEPYFWTEAFDDDSVFGPTSTPGMERASSLNRAGKILAALADDLLPEGFDPDYLEAERGEDGQRVFFAGPPYEATTGVATEREGTGRTIPAAIANALNGGEQ